MNFKAIVLSAGKGTRMKSKLPKVVHKVCGKEMVNHVITASKSAGVQEVVTILGHQHDIVESVLPEGTVSVIQKEQLGTGHAVKIAKEHIKDDDTVVILCGDTPLVKGDTLKKLFSYHLENDFHATVLTAETENPRGYGRIIRDNNDKLLKIVEEKDANSQEKLIKEINSGIYCFNGKSLREALDLIKNDNSQGEFYLTDTIYIMRDKGLNVGAFKGSDIEEVIGVNSKVELAKAESIMRKQINEKHMLNGVTIIDPNSTYIDLDVKIEQDTIIYPGVSLQGNTKIERECIIGANTSIVDSKIGNNTDIKNSTIIESTVGENTNIGPYAYLRPNSVIGNNCKIGDFVEVKNATIGDNSKASHLAYVGDANIGKNVNIGCGVVFVNYDGKNKFKSTVKDNAFIGSNSNIVAPVMIEEFAYIATGSTITEDIPNGALAIARTRQTNKENWVFKKR